MLQYGMRYLLGYRIFHITTFIIEPQFFQIAYLLVEANRDLANPPYLLPSFNISR